jgi:ketosteroid isomerase-like protein
MDERVKEFFVAYERANSASDIAAISGLYADTFMFGGINGHQAVKKEDFLMVVPKMKAHFSSLGLADAHLQTVEARTLGPKYLLATVVWRMKLRDSCGGKHVDATATYVLAREGGDALGIVLQIDHQDLASVIASQKNNGDNSFERSLKQPTPASG